MTGVLIIQPLLALVCGLLVLFFPRFLNYVVAAFLIMFGLAGLFPHIFN